MSLNQRVRSEDGKGTFVLAGYISATERWAVFEKEWRELLPKTPLNSKRRRNFKMSEMAMNEERMEWVQAFFKVIQRHVLASSVRIDMKNMEAAKRRIDFPSYKVDFGYFNYPDVSTIRALYDRFHNAQIRMG